MITLKDKSVLLITARLFGYELEIQTRLRELGATVDWYDQRPSNTFLVKSLIRIDNRILYLKIREYYRKIINETRSVKYDYVLFVSPETITSDLILEMKRVQKDACFILYMWDSFRNKSANIKKTASCFDFRYSFDKQDCSIPEYQLIYRPLFFLNEYSQIDPATERSIDLLFIGTLHSDRFRILSTLKRLSQAMGLSNFYYMFFPSKILFLLQSLLNRELRNEPKKNFQFKSLSKHEVLGYVAKSWAVVDIQHPNQLGLTMRTIEVLGARRKLITTNKDIVNYDFYSPQNIRVIDRDKPTIDKVFFDTEMVPVEISIYNRYSIDGWLSDVLNLKEK